MYNTSVISRLIGGLSLVVALPMGLLAEGHNQRIADLQATDPNGFVLTLTAVSVVFSALALLIVFFKGLGRLMLYLSERNKPKPSTSTLSVVSSTDDTPAGEVAVAIAMALRSKQQAPNEELVAAICLSIEDYLSNRHDMESYKLTIKPRPTQWNHRGQTMRQYPY